jgi:hypothetical protein
MATSLRVDNDHMLAHQFIRLFGRRPTPIELAQYRDAQTRVRYRLHARARRHAARMITRL